MLGAQILMAATQQLVNSSACLPGFSVTFLVQSIYTDYANKVFFNKISQEKSSETLSD